MKKYFPIFLSIMAFTAFLAIQVFLNITDSSANLSVPNKKLKHHYEASFQKTSAATLGKETLSLNQIEAPIVIINFWASWCAPCKQELPLLEELTRLYRPDQLMVIGINTDENQQMKNISKTKDEYDITFTIVPDVDNKLGSSFMVSTIPTSLVFYRGELIDTNYGFKDFLDPGVLDTFNRLLAQEDK